MLCGVEPGLEVLPGVALVVGGDCLWGACGDDGAAVLAAFGADVDDPVGGGDDVEVVLDDDDGIADVD